MWLLTCSNREFNPRSASSTSYFQVFCNGLSQPSTFTLKKGLRSSQTPTLAALNEDVLTEIFAFLPFFKDFLRLTNACRKFRNARLIATAKQVLCNEFPKRPLYARLEELCLQGDSDWMHRLSSAIWLVGWWRILSGLATGSGLI